jgi:hypothetical protein
MHEYCMTEAVQFQFACTGQASGPTVSRGIPDNGATDYVADGAACGATGRAGKGLLVSRGSFRFVECGRKRQRRRNRKQYDQRRKPLCGWLHLRGTPLPNDGTAGAQFLAKSTAARRMGQGGVRGTVKKPISACGQLRLQCQP